MNGNNAIAVNPQLRQHTPDSVFTVAILGAESTGKTTLCQDLAEHFSRQGTSAWVPEYMRDYLQDKWNQQQATCTWQDLLPIAQGQIELENKLAQQVAQTVHTNHTNKGYLFCDTSLFEIMVYANWYYGDCPTELTQAALAHHYDLILLTKVDTPWVADDLRDSPFEREAISARFEDELNDYHKGFRLIGGDRMSRVRQVAVWLQELS
ncbi:ATP-binding protein [uncultured Psychrobacter sp.]|uniref:ATP-binding protein n=1 Tax=uncultured Psychrobacter sp. TaxID=259303 RepID=UPI002602E51E|nr:ATP-binding protein [uncultured Psychrobacter sp.]